MKRIFVFLFLISQFFLSQAQIGIPQVKNFSSLDYKGGTQNWKIDQDERGIMYFANNEGLITFDGKHWKLYPLPHKTIVRSLKVMANGKIYVGGQDEIGYFFPDNNGSLKFNSLKEFIPLQDRQLQDIWDIASFKDEVYFRTNSKILHLKNGTFNIYKSKGTWGFLNIVNGEVYAQDVKEGLFIFKNNSWENIVKATDLNNISIKSILPYSKDTLLVTTNKNGLIFLHNNKFVTKKINQSFFENEKITASVNTINGWFALSTVSSGCVIIDRNANIIQKFTYKDGLQKNNVRSIFTDKNQNLWLGLDDGIDFIAFNNAIKYIYPDPDKQTSSYSSKILDNYLYVGTSNGLFSSRLTTTTGDLSFNKNPFVEIANTKQQIWNLNIINKQLLVANEDGAVVIKNNEAKSLYKIPGTWMFQSLSNYSPSKEILAGTYNGLIFLNFENNQFKQKTNVTGANESLRFIVYDHNNNLVWASHPYRGIYKFTLSDDKQNVEKTNIYTSKNGLPSSLGNYVASVKNRIVVSTIKGLYEFDYKNQKFNYSKFFEPIFGNMVIQYLKEDTYGNIWFINDKKVGVVDFSRKKKNKDFDIIYFPELSSKIVAGFENIYPFNNQNIFIGSNKGLIHVNYQNYLKNIRPLSVNLTQVKIIGDKDSAIFGGYFLTNGKTSKTQGKQQQYKLSYQNNSLHFEFSSTLFEQQNSIQFSYQLEGFDETWSVWSAKNEKDYTNLPAGKYTFKIKSRNNLGNESSIVDYHFTIISPWFQSWWFYLIGFLTVCFLVNLIILRQKRKYQKAQEYLQKEHLLAIEKNEKEIVKLRNQNLEAEVNFKNQELATTTMHLMQRGKLISKIKEELVPIVKTDKIEEGPEEYKRILSLINDADRADTDWEHFAVHFDHVHANFLSKLKAKLPALSANDLKLCAYLKMNLTSKEIAQLMSVTVRAVEVSRYRLRKKLDVSSETNLFNYLMEVISN